MTHDPANKIITDADADPFKDFEWKQCSTEPDPNVCEDCGGMGEIIMGDGGGPNGEYTETGYSSKCETCDGSGDAGLRATAKQALTIIEED